MFTNHNNSWKFPFGEIFFRSIVHIIGPITILIQDECSEMHDSVYTVLWIENNNASFIISFLIVTYLQLISKLKAMDFQRLNAVLKDWTYFIVRS